MLFTVTERSQGVAKTKGIMGIQTCKMEALLLWNLLFQISSDFVTFENNFRDGFLNQSYVGLNLYLIGENQKIL